MSLGFREARTGDPLAFTPIPRTLSRLGSLIDRCAGRLIVGLVVAHAAGLLSAAEGVGLRIKIQYDPLAFEVGEPNSAAVLVGDGEVGGWIANLDHGAMVSTGIRHYAWLEDQRLW